MDREAQHPTLAAVPEPAGEGAGRDAAPGIHRVLLVVFAATDPDREAEKSREGEERWKRASKWGEKSGHVRPPMDRKASKIAVSTDFMPISSARQGSARA